MATNRLPVQLLIRNAPAENWVTRNPTLEPGEYGLESDTFLLKIGDGVRDWTHLPYLNKLNSSYFTRTSEGVLTFSEPFATQINNLIAQGGGSGGTITIPDFPVNDTDAANKAYVDWAVAHAGHLKREVVQALPEQDIDENTLYMVLAPSGNQYEEYLYINGQWDIVGTTGDGGAGFTLEVATRLRLGGVKASGDPDKIDVTQEGFMTLNTVSTSKLYVPTGDTLILYGGTA